MLNLKIYNFIDDHLLANIDIISKAMIGKGVLIFSVFEKEWFLFTYFLTFFFNCDIIKMSKVY